MFKSSSVFPALMILVLLALVMPNVINLIKGPAETPGVFDEHYTLTQASGLSADTGKPMLVLVTADWCPPCQTLKRNTMTDPSVIDWIQSNTIPVYLEDGENGQEIGSLPVSAYPTTLLIQDGQVLASLQGAAGAREFINKLSSKLSSAMITDP